MRNTKKIVMSVIALLPILPLLVFVVANIGGDTGIDFLEMGSISVIDGSFVYDAGTWTERILGDLDVNASGTLMQTMRDMLINLNTSIGLPLCLPIVLGFWYLLYLFVIYLFDMIVSVLSWIPRKLEVLMQ